MFNFSFQISATLGAEVHAIFWCTLQSLSSGWMRQKEVVVQYIGLTITLRVGMWNTVHLASTMLYTPPVLRSSAFIHPENGNRNVSQDNGKLQPHAWLNAESQNHNLDSGCKKVSMSACLMWLTLRRPTVLNAHNDISLLCINSLTHLLCSRQVEFIHFFTFALYYFVKKNTKFTKLCNAISVGVATSHHQVLVACHIALTNRASGLLDR
jgi:hypothetical protein